MATASFKEVEAILQKALDAKTGSIRVECGSHGDAINIRQRLNNWRVKDRRDNLLIYGPGHHLYGVSVYDCLSMRVPSANDPDSHYIYITKRRTLATFEIEELPRPGGPLNVEELPDLTIEGDDTK